MKLSEIPRNGLERKMRDEEQKVTNYTGHIQEFDEEFVASQFAWIIRCTICSVMLLTCGESEESALHLCFEKLTILDEGFNILGYIQIFLSEFRKLGLCIWLTQVICKLDFFTYSITGNLSHRLAIRRSTWFSGSKHGLSLSTTQDYSNLYIFFSGCVLI